MPILLIFIIVPIIEITVLMQVSDIIGVLPTVAMVCLTAALGLGLIRKQGFSAMQSAQSRLQQGQLPAQEIVDGICLAIGGALLLTPGFVTDTFGFALLIPGLRKILLSSLVAKLFASKGGFSSASFSTGTSSHFKGAANDGAVPKDGKSRILDGEFRREDD